MLIFHTFAKESNVRLITKNFVLILAAKQQNIWFAILIIEKQQRVEKKRVLDKESTISIAVIVLHNTNTTK